MSNRGKVLSLYDFASKQAYIYKTSKIKEISGASALLSGMYRRFFDILKKNNIRLNYDVSSPFSVNDFDNSSDYDGVVLYDGGGNLMVLWKSSDVYIEANKILSSYLLKKAPGVSLIASHVRYSGAFDDVINAEGKMTNEGDRTRLYKENSRRKNLFPSYDLPAVSPFTQVDPMTFLPVTYKRGSGDGNSVYPAAECSLSSDRYYKAKNYKHEADALDALDELEEGMLAVIYIDGNSMGKKLVAVKSDDYDTGVRNLRNFSEQVNSNFVIEPVRRIKEAGYVFRQVIGGGDEITLICKAKDALDIMKLYFSVLKEEKIDLGGRLSDCTSCAGISVFHAKAPFNVAYDIAEACCEFAKKKAHEKDGNYFCFYYCHSGITNVFEVLYKREQEHASGKPYAYIGNSKEAEDFCCSDRDISLLQKKLCAAGRANVKALGSAAQENLARYQYEVRRVNGYLKHGIDKFDGSEKEMRIVYDMAEFFDLWFAGKEGQHA